MRKLNSILSDFETSSFFIDFLNNCFTSSTLLIIFNTSSFSFFSCFSFSAYFCYFILNSRKAFNVFECFEHLRYTSRTIFGF